MVGFHLILTISVINSRAEHGVLFVKYCSVLLQALTIEADEDLLFSLSELMQINGIWEDATEE